MSSAYRITVIIAALAAIVLASYDLVAHRVGAAYEFFSRDRTPARPALVPAT